MVLKIGTLKEWSGCSCKGKDSVTLGLGHSISKPKGFIRSLHGLSSLCFYVLNRYAANTTTRLL